MDLIQREGRYPPPPGSSEILGVEFSGTITALSDGVSGWKVGDEVFGLAGGVGVCLSHSTTEYSYQRS